MAYSSEVREEVALRIAKGHSSFAISQDEGMPNNSTIDLWKTQKTFQKRVAEIKEGWEAGFQQVAAYVGSMRVQVLVRAYERATEHLDTDTPNWSAILRFVFDDLSKALLDESGKPLDPATMYAKLFSKETSDV